MKATSAYVGIDVSLQHLDCYHSKEEALKGYSNDLEGWQVLSQKLSPSEICIVEATGPYHIGLATYLYEQGHQVCVVNPLSVKYFSRMQLRRAKTDKVDAILLAQYGQLTQPSFWSPTAVHLTQLRQLLLVSEQFTKQKNMLSNQLKAIKKVPNFSTKAVKMLEDQIDHLKQKLKELQLDIADLMQSYFKELAANLRSIPGLGPKTVATLILLTQGFTKFKNYKAFIAYAGLAPRTYESGKSVKGIAHICKLGSAYIRKLLYQCSQSAKRFNPVCKALFERLTQKNGKPFKVAMIAVANKLIKLAFAIAQSGKPFDPDYLAKANK